MGMVLLVGMKALGKGAARTKVFGEISAASGWLAPIMGEDWTSDEIAAVFRSVSEGRAT